MKKPLIIFGLGDIAQMAYYYFKNDSSYEIVAFCVDAQFITSERLFEIPVVAFEDVEKKFSPSEYEFFVAVGYKNLNKMRRQKYDAAKQKGYKMASYISSKAVVLTKEIGDNAFILENNTIQPFVKIGDNVTIWSGNHVGHHSVVEDNCFISSHVVISGGVVIGENSFLGVNSTIRDHIKIGKENIIGAATLILKDTQDFSVYTGLESSKSAKIIAVINHIIF